MTCREAYPGSGVLFEATCIDGHGDAKDPSYAAFLVRFYGAATPITLVATHATGDPTGYVQVHYELPDDTPLGIADVVFVAEGSEFSVRDPSTLIVKALPFTVTEPDIHTVYWGVGAAGITTPAALMALGHADIQRTRSWTMELTPNAQYVYVCYPATWGISVTSQGIGFASKTARTANLTAYDGTTVSYTVLESYNALGDGTTRTYDAKENA